MYTYLMFQDDAFILWSLFSLSLPLSLPLPLSLSLPLSLPLSLSLSLTLPPPLPPSLSPSLSLSLTLPPPLPPSSLYSSTNHESDFATFHLSVIKRTAGKGGQKPGCAINLSLKAFHGDLAQLRRDFPITLTQTMAVVHKLGFPDVILPGKRD